jgi:hypothetical protein
VTARSSCINEMRAVIDGPYRAPFVVFYSDEMCEVTMNRVINVLVFAALTVLLIMPAMAADTNTLRGVYVEARTAEVFTGACLMGSEAETTGRQAVLAWKIDGGSFNGVSLEGLSVVAAVVGDKNLGIYELGGEKPVSRSAVFVDARATAAQRQALVAMVKQMSKVTGTVVTVASAPIEFSDNAHEIAVTAPKIALAIDKHPEHAPGCGAEQWFHPLASLNESTIGMAKQHSFNGPELGSKWSDPDKVSAFFGTFSY